MVPFATHGRGTPMGVPLHAFWSVFVPPFGICDDVSTNCIEIAVIANNVFVIIPLPDAARHSVVLPVAGDGRFEGSDDRSERTPNRATEFAANGCVCM